jgi:hypothetical protein
VKRQFYSAGLMETSCLESSGALGSCSGVWGPLGLWGHVETFNNWFSTAALHNCYLISVRTMLGASLPAELKFQVTAL